MIMDKDYWNNYYLKNSEKKENSGFSQLISNFLNKGDDLIELGCGDGRDAFYFSISGINVYAIDQSEEIIKLNKKKSKENLFFFCDDFTKDPSFLEKGKLIKHVYSRFTLHSISKSDFEKTIDWIYKRLDVGGFFYFEVRSINDPLYGIGETLGDNGFYSTHYRRFFHPKEILTFLKDFGFSPIIFIEDYLSANIPSDKSVVIRAVLKKL